MKFATFAASAAAIVAGGSVLAVPTLNPQFNPDGTQTWFTGNDTQYPSISDAVNAASDGDTIVINGGEYVTSVHVNNSDVTLIPIVRGGSSTTGAFQDVTMINPTEGFNNDNGYAIRMSGSANSYVGYPRQFTQLANGQESSTVVMVYSNAGGQSWGTVGTQPLSTITGNNMSVQSRSIDNVAILSTDGLGTFENIDISTSQGFGGGIICTGSANKTQFVQCNMNACIATGNALTGVTGVTAPVNVITVTGGEPEFLDCVLGTGTTSANEINNSAGTDGIVAITGGHPIFDDVQFNANYAQSANGMVMVSGASTRATFSRCSFDDSVSRFGTFYWDATGATAADGYCSFYRCNFSNNDTANTFGGTNNFPAGGMAWVDGAVAGDPPLILFSDCGGTNNNGGGNGYQANNDGNFASVASNWHPYARIGVPFNQAAVSAISDIPATLTGDANGDGVVDLADLDKIHDLLGTCSYDGTRDGRVDVDDLLGLIGAFGGLCQ